MADERGSTTLWILALSLAMLLVGGISVDLWRALSAQRLLAGIADAAAIAAASGVDVDHYRAEQEILLDPALARELALDLIALEPDAPVFSAPPEVTVDNGTTAVVVLRSTFDLTLLGLVPTDEDLEIRVEAAADATLRP